jgi:hypothetical protein
MDMTRPFLTDTAAVQPAGGFGQGPNRGFTGGNNFTPNKQANDKPENSATPNEEMVVDVSLVALITLLTGKAPITGNIIDYTSSVPPLLRNPRAMQAVAAYQTRVKQARAMQIVPDTNATFETTAALVKQLQDLAKNGATHLPLKRENGQSLESAVRKALSQG